MSWALGDKVGPQGTAWAPNRSSWVSPVLRALGQVTLPQRLGKSICHHLPTEFSHSDEEIMGSGPSEPHLHFQAFVEGKSKTSDSGAGPSQLSPLARPLF